MTEHKGFAELDEHINCEVEFRYGPVVRGFVKEYSTRDGCIRFESVSNQVAKHWARGDRYYVGGGDAGMCCFTCVTHNPRHPEDPEVEKRDQLVGYIYNWCFDNTTNCNRIPTRGQIRETLKALDALYGKSD